jgi:hypothetical protein
MVLLRRVALNECFGVAHPAQLLSLDVGEEVGPACLYATLDGKPVPCQPGQGTHATVQASLPAAANRTLELHCGKPRAAPPANPVQVKTLVSTYELTNGLTGVRVPQSIALGHAPIQGIRYRDGSWSAYAGSPLRSGSGWYGEQPPLIPKAGSVRFLERGLLRVVVEVAYQFDRPDYYYGNDLLIPGGTGFYRCTIELQAGQPSILVTEDTDMDLGYVVDLGPGLKPTQGRYRGHHATELQYGREADGRLYRPAHERDVVDATVDFPQDRSVSVSHYASATTRPPLAVWNPWAANSGWVWQAYDPKAAAGSNLVGLFAGPASGVVGAGNSGVGFASRPVGASIQVGVNRRGPDARLFPRNRFRWGLFVGRKSDLENTNGYIPTVVRQQNLHAGVNLGKLPDMPAASADLSGNPEVRTIQEKAQQLSWVLAEQHGVYSPQWQYWMGGLQMVRAGYAIARLLADPATPAEDRVRLRAVAELFGRVLWDDDFAPLYDGHGLGLGTANMPVQQRAYRDFFAMLLHDDPRWKPRAVEVRQRTLNTLHGILNEHGAPIGSTHYVGASMAPTVNTLRALQATGADPFGAEPRLLKFGVFALNLLTPPDPRFGGLRKTVCIGDGSTEGWPLLAPLADGFHQSYPGFTARLQGAWKAQGSPTSDFFGEGLPLSTNLPSMDPLLGNLAFPDYYSVLRSGWGTSDESAVFFIAGDFYRDHRHIDQGGVILYLLGVPVSLDWGSLYEPHVTGGLWHSCVQLVEGDAWKSAGLPLDAGNTVWTFATGGYGPGRTWAEFRSGAVSWNREVLLDGATVRINDEVSAPFIWTINLMAKSVWPEWPARPETAPFPAQSLLLSFAGQWGVNFDLILTPVAPVEVALSQFAHGYHPATEKAQFRQATGRDFEERQVTLRVKVPAGKFSATIQPRRSTP